MKTTNKFICIVLILFAAPAIATAQLADPQDQEVINALNSGSPNGAIISTEVGCAILTGFFNGDNFAAFGALFPETDCKGGTFEKSRPNGKNDLHMNGAGMMFLVVQDPFTFFPSEGSRVKYNFIFQDGAASVIKISGTLSDGSRVRGHFTVNLNGNDEAGGDFLWVEGIGYVVGRL